MIDLFMQQALALARDGLGRVAPNPSVGCVIVKDSAVIAAARTADGGRPHAETQALALAGEKARGATMYVTLEPCHTHGKTPPCVDAIITAGIARVMIACRDPYQQARGEDGLEILRRAGIAVDVGMGSDEALTLNEGFFTVVTQARPFVSAKIATTLDGRIALANGESRWITGPESRQLVHEMRACHDAVLAGINTVLADDPLLNVRLLDNDSKPARIVIDRRLRTPLDSQLVRTAGDSPVIIAAGPQVDAVKEKQMTDAGVKILRLPEVDDILPPLLAALARDHAITRLFVEGGGHTVTSFLKAGLIDRLYWFRAPKIIGGDGIAAFQAMGLTSMADIPLFTIAERRQTGVDCLEVWYRADRNNLQQGDSLSCSRA